MGNAWIFPREYGSNPILRGKFGVFTLIRVFLFYQFPILCDTALPTNARVFQ